MTWHPCLATVNTFIFEIQINSDKVFMFMRDNRLDVMTLLETWLDESVFDAEVFPDSSDLTRDRNRRDGGVAIVLSNNVYVIVYADFCKGHVESLWIECFLVADVLYCFVVFTDHPLVIIFLIILLWNMKKLFLHGSSQHWLFWVTYISHLANHKAVGIPAKFVKASPINMALVVTKLINKSILSGD